MVLLTPAITILAACTALSAPLSTHLRSRVILSESSRQIGQSPGDGEATRDPEPDAIDPKGKQVAIQEAESFFDFLAQRNAGAAAKRAGAKRAAGADAARRPPEKLPVEPSPELPDIFSESVQRMTDEERDSFNSYRERRYKERNSRRRQTYGRRGEVEVSLGEIVEGIADGISVSGPSSEPVEGEMTRALGDEELKDQYQQLLQLDEYRRELARRNLELE